MFGTGLEKKLEKCYYNLTLFLIQDSLERHRKLYIKIFLKINILYFYLIKIEDSIHYILTPFIFAFCFRIKFTVSAKNGGKVFYQDRSNVNGIYQDRQYFLNGITTTEILEIEFDIYPPVHCFEQSDDCKRDALTATDFLTQVILGKQ